MKYLFFYSFFIFGTFSQVRAQIISTSFEGIPCPNALYFDPMDPATPHPLDNQNEQPILNWPETNQELGFNAYYSPYDQASVGLSDGDSVGITDRTTIVGGFSEGTQGYEISDCDGNYTLEFTPIDLQGVDQASIAIDVFIAPTGYEGDGVANSAQSDRLHIYVKDLEQQGQIDLLNTTGNDINDLNIEGRWLNLTADISRFNRVQLIVTARNNTAAEAFYLDRVEVQGILSDTSTKQPDPVIFPNPTRQSFTLVGSDHIDTEMALYDIFGHHVWTGHSQGVIHDVSMLQSGLYFLSIIKDKNIRTQKLIIE
ncbi:MAG: T9SS type A sorting domain-containing protein [Flavobacteriaceae bacterium]|nr:T9SS type A sorting domain-containing protein [Flavobacteriaceae bacterium]